MNCPGCGSNNATQTIYCARCGANLSAFSDLISGRPADQNAVAEWTGILLKKHYTGRRDTIAGLLLLAGAFVILRVLISTAMPPFIALLWTCWMFLWGMISLAQGAGKWLASRNQLKLLGWRVSKGRIETSRLDPASQIGARAQSVMITDEASVNAKARQRTSTRATR